jgi:hypothetical protein
VIKEGPKTILDLTSRCSLQASSVTAADFKEVLEVEKLLERLTGYRFHINLINED